TSTASPHPARTHQAGRAAATKASAYDDDPTPAASTAPTTATPRVPPSCRLVDATAEATPACAPGTARIRDNGAMPTPTAAPRATAGAPPVPAGGGDRRGHAGLRAGHRADTGQWGNAHAHRRPRIHPGDRPAHGVAARRAGPHGRDHQRPLPYPVPRVQRGQ